MYAVPLGEKKGSRRLEHFEMSEAARLVPTTFQTNGRRVTMTNTTKNKVEIIKTRLQEYKPEFNYQVPKKMYEAWKSE